MLTTAKHIPNIIIGSTKDLLIWMQLGERGEEGEAIKFLDQKILSIHEIWVHSYLASFPPTTLCPKPSLTENVQWFFFNTWGDIFIHLPHLQLSPECGFTAVLVDTFLYIHRWQQPCSCLCFLQPPPNSSRFQRGKSIDRERLNGHITNKALFSTHSKFICLQQ